MAPYLLDTNILLRSSDPLSPSYMAANNAVTKLLSRREQIFITAQNLVEFWAVVTRPISANGFGWDPGIATAEIQRLRNQFPLLLDEPAIFATWFNLISTFGITGKRTHDARLVAVMQVLRHNSLAHIQRPRLQGLSWDHCHATLMFLFA